MESSRKRFLLALCAVGLCSLAVPAFAQPQADGGRFRFGIALSGGGAFVSGWELGMAGLDLRFGAQINHLLGVYAQPFFMVGGGSRGGITGVTGFAGGSVVVDATFMDRFFVGLGGGGAVLNNPAAGFVHVRAGVYPAVGRGVNGVRRKGFMVGLDLRPFFASGITVLNVMGSIGYEAF